MRTTEIVQCMARTREVVEEGQRRLQAHEIPNGPALLAFVTEKLGKDSALSERERRELSETVFGALVRNADVDAIAREITGKLTLLTTTG